MGSDQGTAVAHARVGQLPSEFVPSGIADRTSETSVTHHALDVEILDRNRLMFTHDRGG